LSFEYLEHTADIIIRAKGKDLKEAFEQAALGFYGVITNLEQITPTEEISFTIESEDIQSLLYDFIDQLIFLIDTKYFISNSIKVLKLELVNEGKYFLDVKLSVEEFQIGKHEQKTEVKAMTYSFMKTGEDFVEFTLDL
jgi:SHS2 domain-containing protein